MAPITDEEKTHQKGLTQEIQLRVVFGQPTSLKGTTSKLAEAERTLTLMALRTEGRHGTILNEDNTASQARAFLIVKPQESTKVVHRRLLVKSRSIRRPQNENTLKKHSTNFKFIFATTNGVQRSYVAESSGQMSVTASHTKQYSATSHKRQTTQPTTQKPEKKRINDWGYDPLCDQFVRNSRP